MAEDMEQDAVNAVLERLDELVALLRRVDTRLEHLEHQYRSWGPIAEDPDTGRPQHLTSVLGDAARRDLVARTGAT